MSKKNVRNALRIIGGRWRSRRIHFPTVDGLRPTTDRVRETVFNWLQQDIVGARCLDLFAGSGALGLEALSRGAAHCVFVERQRAVVKYLHDTLRTLEEGHAQVLAMDARRFLRESAPEPFDVVFLDPPFDADCLPEICRTLEQGGWLAPQACIYLEASSRTGALELPLEWTLTKSERAGAVGYHLARRLVRRLVRRTGLPTGERHET